MGSSVSIYLLWTRRSERSDQRLTLEEAIEVLEAHDKLLPNLSAYENARLALKSLSDDQSLNRKMKAPIIYALAVLKSELVLMSIPVGLWDRFRVFTNSSKTKFVLNSNLRTPVQDWILSNFSPIRTAAHYGKCTLRGVALGVRFAVRLKSSAKRHANEYVFNATEEEIARIEDALQRVDEWDWSVWELARASAGRPLQVTPLCAAGRGVPELSGGRGGSAVLACVRCSRALRWLLSAASAAWAAAEPPAACAVHSGSPAAGCLRWKLTEIERGRRERERAR